MPQRPLPTTAARGSVPLIALSAAAAAASASAWLIPPDTNKARTDTDRRDDASARVGGRGGSALSSMASPVIISTSLSFRNRSATAPFFLRGPLGRRIGNGVALCESSSSTSPALGAPPPANRAAADYASLPFDTRGRAYELLHHPCRSLVESHAIFGPLRGPGKVESYDVYRRMAEEEEEDHFPYVNGGGEKEGDVGVDSEEVAVAFIRVGHSLDGHDSIVHGGVICLLFDDAMGWGYDAHVLTEREKRRKKKGVPKIQYDVSGRDVLQNKGKDEEENIPTIVTANLSVDFRAPLPADTETIMRIRYDGTEGRKIFFSARLESVDSKTLYSEAKALFVIPRKE